MGIMRTLLWATSLSSFVLNAAAAPTQSSQSYHLTREHATDLVNNYNVIWGSGNFSILPQVLTPNIVYYQDRFPSGTGNGSFVLPINNSSAFQSFVTNARLGWESYTFDVLYHFNDWDRIAVRWTLNAVSAGKGVGSPRLLPAGAKIAFNGTDTYHVNCDGLIDEIASTQDYITDYHQLLVPLGTV